MDLKTCSTKELVEEVLRRVDHVDSVINIVNSGALDFTPKAPPPRESKRVRASTRVRNEDIVGALREAGRPLTTYEIGKRIPRSTSGMVSAHLRRALAAKLIEQVGTARPFAYRMKGAGE